MNICNLEYADSILSSIENFLYFSDLDSLKETKDVTILEKHVLDELVNLKEFNLSSYIATSTEFKQSIDYLFNSYDLVISDFMSDITSSIVKTKSNVSTKFSSVEIVDLFHTLPILKSEFENKTNSEIVRNILIGDTNNKSYVSSNEEVIKNLNNYKNKLFIEIQQFLKDNKKWKRKIINLYNDNGDILDYTAYKEAMIALEKYFFNGDNFTMIETYSNKLIPNLDSSLKLNNDVLSAYYAGILLSNFDSVMSVYYSDILNVNYNMFNDLRSNLTSENKYTLKIEGIKTTYWLGDSHAAEGSESAESKLVKLLVSTIPIYNKKGVKTNDFMEMKDFYLIASLISNFEILEGNKLKNQEDSKFKYFNEEPKNSLKWYLNAIIDAVNDKEGSIPELKNHFQYSYEFILSIKNYIESPDFNLEIKESNSDTSILYIFSQIINNNFGASYTKYDSNGKYKIQEMYKQNFNNIQVQSMLFAKMVSNDKKDLYNNDLFKIAIDDLFSDVTGIAIKDLKSLSNAKKVKLSKLIRNNTGITLSYLGIDELLSDLEVNVNNGKPIDIKLFKQYFINFISAAKSDFNIIKEKVKTNEISKISKGDAAVSEYIPNSIKNSFFIGLTNAYLANYVVKVVMNVETLTGEKLPTFKLATLTQKDTELFQQQREFEKNNKNKKAVYRSLLIQDTPAIIGTGTKLELVNKDVNKPAVKFNISENFLSDFQFDFLQNIINNNQFAVMIGNYSDKNTVLTKIINGKFKVEGTDITKLSNTKLLDQVKNQAGNYFKDTVDKVFDDYSILLDIKLTTDFEKNVKLINDKLNKIDVRSLSKLASDKNINFTEQLHYSKYDGKYTLNQYLIDNYKIFNDTKLFKEFVKYQEQEMINKYKTFNKSFDGKLRFTGDIKIPDVLKALNLSDENFDKIDGKSDYLALENSKGLNPILKKWMWTNALFRNEYLFVSGKGEYMHSTKNIKYREDKKSSDWTKDRWEEYFLEMNGRLISMAKRNVMFTATIEVPVRKSKLGVPENINMSVIEDYKDTLYNISGNLHDQDIHDGSSYINYVYSLMIDNSYPDKGYSGTKKQFATFITEYGNVIKKDAESVITNDKIRNSLNSGISLYNKVKQMLDIPIGNLNFTFGKSFDNEFFFIKNGQNYRIDQLDINGNNYSMIVSKKIDNEWEVQETLETGKFNSLFDLWNLFGAEYSVDVNGNLNEGSNELLYKIVTTEDNNGKYILKDKMIHVLSNLSSVKTGATNVNSKEKWNNDKPLAFFTFQNRFMGPQLDAGHEADASQIKEVTQVISALAQNSKTAALALEAYNDIAMVIKKATEPYLKYLNPKDEQGNKIDINKEELYKYLSDKFVKTIQNTKGDNIAKVLVQSFSKDVNIPFSNQNFYVAFVRDIITRMNNEFITRYYSGTGAILIPSHKIVQVYDIPQIDGSYLTVTQEDLAKEAFKNFDKSIAGLTNKQIINNYIETLLIPTPTTWDKIQVGDTVQRELTPEEIDEINKQVDETYAEMGTPEMELQLYNQLIKDKSHITLSNPELYYRLKKYDNTPIIKINSVPRDLKPTEITFNIVDTKTLIENQRSIFDTDSIRLKFKFSELIKAKDIDITSEDYIILNNFYKYVTNDQTLELIKDIKNKNVEKALSELLNKWTQRNLELLDDKKIMKKVDKTTNFEEFFNGDNLLMIYSDAKNLYTIKNSDFVKNYKFKEAELILGDIYQSKFNRDFNDSIYDIKSKGYSYFFDKLNKNFEKDDTEADIKLNLSNLDIPIYIKYVDELPGNDYSINIKAEKFLDSKKGIITKFVRYNQKGEVVYTLPDYKNVRVNIVDGKETIFIKAVASSKTNNEILWNKVDTFSSNLQEFISSCKSNITSFVPLMNNDLKLTKQKNSVSSKISFDINTLMEFSKFSGYKIAESDYVSKDWLIENKLNILNQLSKKMYASWEKSHEVVAARIPSQSMQSFMPMKNIAYHKTKSNDAYVSVWQVWLQGSDFDIDKAYILGSGFNSNGHFDSWTPLDNYSTKEQLDEIEKFPLPNGIDEFEISNNGEDFTEEFIDFHESLKDNNDQELSATSLSIINTTLRKLGKNSVGQLNLDKLGSLYSLEELQTTLKTLREVIVNHNSYERYLKTKDSVKNSVVSRIKQIISTPSNQILATTPVDVKIWHDAADLAVSKKKTTPILLSSYDMFSMYKQQRDAAVGKDDVGIAANGLKSMFALTSYFNNYFDNNFDNNLDNLRRSLKTFKKEFIFIDENNNTSKFIPGVISDINLSESEKNNLKLAIGDFENYRTNSAIALSSFTSAATDNAKELLMAKINANVELASMHIYLLILGFTPNQIAEIMTSDVVEELIEGLEVNLFFNNITPKVNVVLGNLIKKYKDDPIKLTNITSIRDIYHGAQEVKLLSKLLSANQKTSANTKELNKFLTNFETIIYSRENIVFGDKLKDFNFWNEYKDSIDPSKNIDAKNKFDKLIEKIFENNKQLNSILDKKHVEDIIKKAAKLNIIGGNFDFRLYINKENKDYIKVTKEYYNLIKNSFNIFDVIKEVPHFKEMINSIILSHNILSISSVKYNAVYDILKTTVKENANRIIFKDSGTNDNIKNQMGNEAFPPIINDLVVTKVLAGVDIILKSKWLKTNRLQEYSFNVSNLLRKVNETLDEKSKIKKYPIYLSDDARNINPGELSNSSSEIKFINEDDAEDTIIDMSTDYGIANFKKMVEELLLPLLQNKSNIISDSFNIQSVFNILGIKGNSIVSVFPLGDISNPVVADKSKKLLKAFNDLDYNKDTAAMIKNNNGKPLKWRDLFYVYNLLVNNEKYGDLRLTPLFQDYIKEKDSLGYDYVMFSSKVDIGEVKLFDYLSNLSNDPNYQGADDKTKLELETKAKRELANDILFYSFNVYGKMSIKTPETQNHILSVSNPDFVVVTSITETIENKKRWVEFNEIMKLIKSRGFIIKFEC